MSYNEVMDSYHPGKNFVAYVDRLRQYFSYKMSKGWTGWIIDDGTETQTKLMSLTAADMPYFNSLEELITVLTEHYFYKENKTSE